MYDNDVMAIAGLAVAHELGFRVPDDVSLVAWDDSVLCRLVHPPLTALSRDIPAYGSQAARELLSVIARELPECAEDSMAHLVARGSTAAPSEQAVNRTYFSDSR
jgi:DNA-binding LacI/PurR family transcriptional regulator